MRNFEQRIEQIRIRSEKLRAERKRQRRLAAVCVPLILCLGLYGVFALPSPKYRLPETAGMGMPGGTVSEGAYYAQSSHAVEKIRVSGMGDSRTITKQSEILPVVAYLEPLVWQTADFIGAGGAAIPGENKNTAPKYSENESVLADSAAVDYSITLILAGGGREVFLLTGTQLENPKSGQTVTLTPDQQKVLLTLLGL